jgi:hypothetical protein
MAMAALMPILGGPEDDSNMLRFITHFGSWRVVTFVDHDVEQCALRYSHSVFGPKERLPVALNVSCLMWLGISGETRWQTIEGVNAGRVAVTLARLCERFIRAAPQLLP